MLPRLASGFDSQLGRQLTPRMSSAGTAAGRGFGSGFVRNVTPAGRQAAAQIDAAANKPMASAGQASGRRFALGFAAATAGLAAGRKALQFVGQSVAEARESNRVGALTAQVIKTTGGAARVTAGQVGALATAISNKTGADDEAIQSGANLLLTFTNVQNRVGKGNDIFNQATQSVTDLSAALGQDTKSSAIQLGKALNDPIRGVTALQRVGVSFTAAQKDQIKTLVDSGNTLAAQKVILGELSKEFGGAAAAATTPAQKLAVSYGNLKEQVGNVLIPVLDRAATALSSKVLPRINDLVVRYGPKVAAFFAGLSTSVGKVDFGAIFGKVKDAVRGVDFGAITGDLKTLGHDVGPQLASVNFAAIGDGLRKVGDGVHFLTEHPELLKAFVAALPVLAAGMLAVHAASSVTSSSLVRTGVSAAQIASTFALAAANRSLAGAMRASAVATGENTLAQNGGMLATFRNTAAAAGSRIAMYASRAATVAWTSAQWLLNAAMSANPLGLVLIAVGALTAGVVLAYQHSATFRRVVSGAFGAVAAAGSAMWENVLRPAFKALADTFFGVVGGILHGAASIASAFHLPIAKSLQRAAEEFDGFKNKVNDSLSGLHDQQIKVSADLVVGGAGTAGDSSRSRDTGGTGFAGRHARGGFIRGAGGPTEDRIPALLSNGEYIIRAAAVRKIGVESLDVLNAARFAKGGRVGDAGAVRSGVTVVPDIGSLSPLDQGLAAWNEQIRAAAVKAVRNSVAVTGGPTFARIAGWIMGHLGTPYSWGGGSPAGPSRGFGRGANTVGFDCSSWTQAAFAAAGLRVPRTAATQQAAARAISRGQLHPGDIGLVGRPAHHVGMYMGSGRWASEHRTGTVSSINSGDGWDNYGRFFHRGGIVPGYGDRHVTVKGGEGVFTREQMAALTPKTPEPIGQPIAAGLDRLVALLERDTRRADRGGGVTVVNNERPLTPNDLARAMRLYELQLAP